jgi:hypothetical protein
MQRIRFVLLVSLAVVSANLVTATTRTSAAEIPAGPLFQLQQQINVLSSTVASQQDRIDALEDRIGGLGGEINLSDYWDPPNVIKEYTAKRYTNYTIPNPMGLGFGTVFGAEIPGTLLTSKTISGENAIVFWKEFYDSGPWPLNNQTLEIKYEIRGDGEYEIGQDTYQPFPADPAPKTSASVYDGPLFAFPYGNWPKNASWGGAFVQRIKFYPPPPTIPPPDQAYARVVHYVILGFEDVTVNGKSYEKCLKVARIRGNQADRVNWYAKDVGAVKMVFTQEEHLAVFNSLTPPTAVNFSGYSRVFELKEPSP